MKFRPPHTGICIRLDEAFDSDEYDLILTAVGEDAQMHLICSKALTKPVFLDHVLAELWGMLISHEVIVV